MFDIIRYTDGQVSTWNDFVAASKNGTFLFNRAYMDYHADRFEDYSLLFYTADGKLFALLPANRRGTVLYSHQGLSYGGLVMSDATTTEMVCHLFAELNQYLCANGISKVVYKPIPHFYHRIPAEEDLFAIALVCRARLVSRDVSSTIIPQQSVRWKRDRRYAANKARTNGICVGRSDDFATFWQILTDNLQQRYHAQPVHSLEEITLLHHRLPQHIELWTATSPDGRTLAGTVLYLNRQTVHAQYISATEEGKHLHAVDAIYDHLIHHAYAGMQYIDLGTSNMPNSNALHESLIHQKEGFGGRAVCCDTYEWDTTGTPSPLLQP